QDVIQEGKELVRQIVPIIEHPSGALYHESGAEANISPIVKDGSNQIRDIGWVIFQVRVLDDNHIACDLAEAGPQGGSFTCVLVMAEKLDSRVSFGAFPN